MRPSIVNISLLAAGCQEVVLVLAWAWTLDCGIMTIMSPSCVCDMGREGVNKISRSTIFGEYPYSALSLLRVTTNAFTI